MTKISFYSIFVISIYAFLVSSLCLLGGLFVPILESPQKRGAKPYWLCSPFILHRFAYCLGICDIRIPWRSFGDSSTIFLSLLLCYFADVWSLNAAQPRLAKLFGVVIIHYNHFKINWGCNDSFWPFSKSFGIVMIHFTRFQNHIGIQDKQRAVNKIYNIIFIVVKSSQELSLSSSSILSIIINITKITIPTTILIHNGKR